MFHVELRAPLTATAMRTVSTMTDDSSPQRRLALATLAREIRERPSPRPVRLVAVDGCGGAGKSTFARRLATACGHAPVLKVDGFLTWAGLDPDGTGWWKRLERDALGPLLERRPARFRVRDWAHDPLGDGLGGWHEVPPAEMIIIEGITSSRRTIAPALTTALWVDAPRAERLRRVTRRDGEERRDRWAAWMRAEDRFFAHDGAPGRADHIISGAPTLAHDPHREVVALGEPSRS